MRRERSTSLRRDEPSWWYDEHAVVVPRLLAPLSFVYGNVAGKRLLQEPGYRSRLPVICVGNFTVGGSGKTPFVRYLCDWMQRRGRKPAVLTRGYGGSDPGPVWVDPARHDAFAIGDEPLLLARAAPTVVARDRAAGARLIEADARGFDTIIMDDGFQNRALAKTSSIVLVAAGRGLGNGRTLPGGPLRAPLAVQAHFADAVVIVDTQPPASAERRRAIVESLVAASARPIFDAKVVPQAEGTFLTNQRVIAYCGIAGPERFFATVEGFGPARVERVAFRDHHMLSEAEAVDLLERARANSAILVTTEKDLARLAGINGHRAALRMASRPIPIRIEIEERDRGNLEALIERMIAGQQ